MTTQYRYCFKSHIPVEEVEASLLLAAVGTESLHGQVSTRLDTRYAFDASLRACVITVATPAGEHFNKLFAGFIARQFGEDAYAVERVERDAEPRNRRRPAAATV